MKKDCPSVSRLMGMLIDEIYENETEKIRRILKANFTGNALQEFCQEAQMALYVGENDGKIVAFAYGWLFHNVCTLYWIYCINKYRAKGVTKDLLQYLEDDLVKQEVYKIEMYVYAEHLRFLDFCSKLGFKKGILIRKSMFGIKIRKLYKYIGDHEQAEKERKIKIMGEAGQGIKLLSFTLASILSQLGYEVSLNLEYDSAVRSGNISSDLIYSEKKIENPIIDEADILIKFTQYREWFPARKLVIDESLCPTKELTCEIKSIKGTAYGFADVAISKFGSKIFINMIALGRILRYLGINIMLLNIKDILPPVSVDKNLAAIKFGFQYRDDI